MTPQGCLRAKIDTEMERLRGRMFNLIDAIYPSNSDSLPQRESTKSLIRDFTGDFWEVISEEIIKQFDSRS